MAGSGNYEQQIKSKRNVEFLGQISRQEIRKLLNSCDIMVFFQIELGLGEQESLACGKPIIMLNSSTNSQMLRNGQEAFLCHTSGDYLAAIAFLQKNREVLEAMRTKARILASEKYAWPVVANDWKKLIASVFWNHVSFNAT